MHLCPKLPCLPGPKAIAKPGDTGQKCAYMPPLPEFSLCLKQVTEPLPCPLGASSCSRRPSGLHLRGLWVVPLRFLPAPGMELAAQGLGPGLSPRPISCRKAEPTAVSQGAAVTDILSLGSRSCNPQGFCLTDGDLQRATGGAGLALPLPGWPDIIISLSTVTL